MSVQIFTAKPIKHSSKIIIKYLGATEEICDDPLECNDNICESERYVINLDNELYARFYKCNMTDKFMMVSKIIPILYASIIHQTSVSGGVLLKIIIQFEITDEIHNEKDLINKEINGIYKMSIQKEIDKDEPKIIIQNVFTTERDTIEMISKIIKTPEMLNVLEDIKELKRKERREKYGYFNDVTVVNKPKYNFNDLVKKYKKTNNFKTLKL